MVQLLADPASSGLPALILSGQDGLTTHLAADVGEGMIEAATEMGTDNTWFVLNKVESREMSDRMMDLLGDLSDKVIGTLPYMTDLVKAALAGHPIDEHLAAKHVDPIVQRLEGIASQCAFPRAALDD